MSAYGIRGLAVGCFLCLSCGLAIPQEALKDRFVRSGDQAYGFLPPELVAGPSVTLAKWSPDGRFILAACREERVGPLLAKTRAIKRDPGEPPGDISLIVWTRDSHHSQEVWRRPLKGALIEDCWWLPGSDRAVAVVQETIQSEPIREVISIRADGGPTRQIARIRFDSEPLHRTPVRLGLATPASYVNISPSKSLCFVQSWHVSSIDEITLPNGRTGTETHHQYDLTPLRDDGSPGPMIRLPIDVFPLMWNKAGDLCYLTHNQRSPDPKHRWTFTYFEFDPRAGKVRQLPGEPADYKELLRSAHETVEGTEPNHWPVGFVWEPKLPKSPNWARPLWLESQSRSDQPRALISADATWYQLSPDGEAILYFNHGSAWVRPLLRVSAREYQAMLDGEARRQAVADADALGNALQDLVEHEERLPTADTLNDRLGAYLADKGMTGRFVATYTDRILPIDAQERARTELGYVVGPGGKAIIYGDGHTVWQDD